MAESEDSVADVSSNTAKTTSWRRRWKILYAAACFGPSRITSARPLRARTWRFGALERREEENSRKAQKRRRLRMFRISSTLAKTTANTRRGSRARRVEDASHTYKDDNGHTRRGPLPARTRARASSTSFEPSPSRISIPAPARFRRSRETNLGGVADGSAASDVFDRV